MSTRRREFPLVNQELVSQFEVQSILGVPLIKDARAVGALMILDAKEEEEEARFGEADVALGLSLGSHAAVAIDNARLYEDAQRRADRLDALRTIDITISASLDLRMTLNVLLEQVINTLVVDAAEVLLYNPRTQILHSAAQRGAPIASMQEKSARRQKHPAGQAALARELVQIPDLAEGLEAWDGTRLFFSEGFRAYFAVPLVSKGQVKGVLQVLNKNPCSLARTG